MLVLNTTRDDEALLLSELRSAPSSSAPPLAVVNNETQPNVRSELYLGGGALVITGRILVVDMLSERVDVARVGGLVVMNAQRVDDNLACILRMYRARNSRGWVKALSDDAAAFTSGFSKVERTLRSLHLRRLQLIPRFHEAVGESLRDGAPDVEELRAPLSARSLELQRALLAAASECLKEVKEASPAVDVATLTLDVALSKSFDQARPNLHMKFLEK